MSESSQLVVFRVEDQRYALPLRAVERVVRAAEVTPLPKAPAIVLGVIDVEGRVLPVLNLRRRLGKADAIIRVDHQFVIAQTPRRAVVLVIDEALDVMDLPANGIIESTRIVPGLEQIQGVVQLPDGMVLIHDLEKFLSLDEERALDEALKEGSDLCVQA